MTTSELADRIDGQVLTPDSADFKGASTLWNVRLDRRPDFVVRCENASDVQQAVELARSEQMPLSVKGGGHSYAANSVREGGLLIDLSGLDSIGIDADDRTATIGGGVVGADLDAAAQEHGLATTLPTVSSVGVVGAALGGGSGWLGRKHGLTLDNILSAELVTASGELVRVSEEENPDLFWAIRGGGGNFGIVTTLVMRLHQLGPQVLSGQVIYPFDDAGGLLRRFRDFMNAAPREFQCYPFMFRVPAIDLFPEETHGDPVLDFVLYHEDPEAEDFIQPLRKMGDPILDLVAPTPYVEVQKAFDPNLPKGHRYLSRAHNLDAMSDEVIDEVVDRVPTMRGAFTAAYFDPLGGAIGDVEPVETAYWPRGAAYGFHCLAGWIGDEEDDEVMSWASDLHNSVGAHADGTVYVNLIAEDEGERIPAAYGDNYEGLVHVKSKWDPENLFRSNYNIPPR